MGKSFYAEFPLKERNSWKQLEDFLDFAQRIPGSSGIILQVLEDSSDEPIDILMTILSEQLEASLSYPPDSIHH
jgi:hypothetical protein